MISLAVAAAGWVGVSSPGDYAAFKFPPTSRHDRGNSVTSFGIGPSRPGFVADGVSDNPHLLEVPDSVIIDRLSCGLPKDEAPGI